MKVDTAIREFVEKYDREAISSINRISGDYSLNISKTPIRLFNIKEGFDKFQDYLKGYAGYKMENADNAEASPQTAIRSSVEKFIETQLFEDVDCSYDTLGTFIESYVNGVKSLTETVETIKRDMMESEVVDNESIGDVNEFADMFMSRLHESFDPAMDRILWASGYNSAKALRSREKTEKPVFL